MSLSSDICNNCKYNMNRGLLRDKNCYHCEQRRAGTAAVPLQCTANPFGVADPNKPIPAHLLGSSQYQMVGEEQDASRDRLAREKYEYERVQQLHTARMAEQYRQSRYEYDCAMYKQQCVRRAHLEHEYALNNPERFPLLHISRAYCQPRVRLEYSTSRMPPSYAKEISKSKLAYFELAPY